VSKIFFIIILIAILAFVVMLLFKRLKAKKEVKEKEAAIMKILDKAGMKRASIDVRFIERDLFSSVMSYIFGIYSMDLNLFPGRNITLDFYSDCEKKLIREKDIGIKRKVHEFQRKSIKVVKIDNSSHYIVSGVEVEGVFYINYDYLHPTLNKNIKKEFSQRIGFINVNDSWQINCAYLRR
jgi:hypothetical protein